LTQHKNRSERLRAHPPLEPHAIRPHRVKEESIMRMFHSTLAVLATLAVATAAAQTGDPNLARSLAATCANCHGTQGVSQGGTTSLAGMAKETMISRMQEFKSGARPATIMHQLSKGYSDEQVALIAGWFAEQKAPK
jgi:cytochrome subunit of sulfide dehydrogenase